MNPYEPPPPPPEHSRQFLPLSRGWTIPISLFALAILFAWTTGTTWDWLGIIGGILAILCIAPWYTRLEAKSEPVPDAISNPIAEHEVSADRFALGKPAIFEGVVFFVIPNDPAMLHAALPARAASEESMHRLVNEVLRVLPEFVRHHHSLLPFIRDRSLTVRMIARYARLDEEIFPRVVVEAAMVEAALSGDDA